MTPRQKEVMSLLSSGYVPKEIKDKMGIKRINTVYEHIDSARKYLNCRTTLQAVVEFNKG